MARRSGIPQFHRKTGSLFSKPLPAIAIPAGFGRKLLRKAALWALMLSLSTFLYELWRYRHVPALGTDSLIYHLTLPAQWLHRGCLSDVDLPFHDGIAQFSPMLAETLAMGLMKLSGDENLTWLIQPAFLLATFGLFYRSARLLGARPPLAMLLTAFLVGFPPFIMSSIIVNNEIVMTAGCAAFLYGLLATRLGRGWPLSWAGAGLGLMLATKYIGVIYAAVGLLLLALPAWRYIRGRKRPWHILRRRLVDLTAGAALLLAGSAFLLRNLALYGNPMWPSAIKLAGIAIFNGLYDTSIYARFGLDGYGLYGMLIDGGDAQFGFNPPWSVILWLCVLIALGLHCARRFRDWHGLAACAAFPILAALLYFAVTPFWKEHRLLFPVYCSLWLAAAFVLGKPLRHVPHVYAGLGWGLVVFFVIYRFLIWWWDELYWLELLAALAVVLAIIPWPRRPRTKAALTAGALLAAILIAAISSPRWYEGYRARRDFQRVHAYPINYTAQGEGWNFLNRLCVSNARAVVAGLPAQYRGISVAYSGSPLVFPLFNPRLGNRVSYVPISPGDRPQATPLQGDVSMGLQLALKRRQRIDEQHWLEGLRRNQVDVLFLVDAPAVYGGVSAELSVVRRHPEIFSPLFHREYRPEDAAPGEEVTIWAVETAGP